VRIGGQPFEGMESSVGKFGGISMAFKMLSANQAWVQIHTGSSDSKVKELFECGFNQT